MPNENRWRRSPIHCQRSGVLSSHQSNHPHPAWRTLRKYHRPPEHLATLAATPGVGAPALAMDERHDRLKPRVVAIGGGDLDPRGVHADPIEPGMAQRHVLRTAIDVRMHTGFPTRVTASAPAPQPSPPHNARCGSRLGEIPKRLQSGRHLSAGGGCLHSPRQLVVYACHRRGLAHPHRHAVPLRELDPETESKSCPDAPESRMKRGGSAEGPVVRLPH
jgi:hypothetical protein